MALTSEPASFDIDEYIKRLRAYRPSADIDKIRTSDPRNVAIAPAFCTLSHSIADYIDSSRANGFSVSEALATMYTLLMPFDLVPAISTYES